MLYPRTRIVPIPILVHHRVYGGVAWLDKNCHPNDIIGLIQATILSLDSTTHQKKWLSQELKAIRGKNAQQSIKIDIGNHSYNQPKKYEYDHLLQQFQRFHQQQALGLHHHLLLVLLVHQQVAAASETAPPASLGCPSYLALQIETRLCQCKLVNRIEITKHNKFISWKPIELVSVKTTRKK